MTSTTRHAILHARSALFVPATRPDRFATAMAAGADAVVLDLEDAVPPEGKDRARADVRAWAATRPGVVVRVNDLDTRWGAADLDAVASLGVAVMVPKATARSLARTRELLPATPVVALIETAAAMTGLAQVCDAAGDPALLRLAFGAIDYATELGLPAPEGPVLGDGRVRLVLASAAAALAAAPLDGVCLALDDPEAVAAAARIGRTTGMGGQLAVHPAQVQAINAAYAPSDREVAWARAVVEAGSSGHVTSVGGQMVDRPVVRRARELLEQAARRSATSAHPGPTPDDERNPA
jgi:citrate lyase subunit beta/citryl-CoA lyase